MDSLERKGACLKEWGRDDDATVTVTEQKRYPHYKRSIISILCIIFIIFLFLIRI